MCFTGWPCPPAGTHSNASFAAEVQSNSDAAKTHNTASPDRPAVVLSYRPLPITQHIRPGSGRPFRFLFAQPGFECTEIEPHQENGETWRCLRVRFPPNVPTHNNFQVGGEQTFFFNENGLLQRLDYVAVGPAAHYCFDHTAFGGLVFPTLRRVVRRPPSGPLVKAPLPY